MPKPEIPEMPEVAPEEVVEKKAKVKEVEPEPESQVIIHCRSTAETMDLFIRVWRTIFLYAHNSSHKSELVHHENITLAPHWTKVPKGTTHKFTLIFSGLPKNCKSFDLIEKIPQSGAFEKRNIRRNKTDVYHVIFQ